MNTPQQLDWCKGTWGMPVIYAGHQPVLAPGEPDQLRQRRLRIARPNSWRRLQTLWTGERR